MRTLCMLVLLFISLRAAVAAQSPRAIPIPQQSDARPVPVFVGSPAVPNPVVAPLIPQNPSMSVGDFSNAHGNSYMSDTYTTSGPLGRSPVVRSSWLGVQTPSGPTLGFAGVLTFDSHGHMVAGVLIGTYTTTYQVQLVLINPATLVPIARFNVGKPQPAVAGERPAGLYFYLDHRDRIVIATHEREIWLVPHDDAGFPAVEAVQKFDLKDSIPENDAVEALQPDFSGRVWFTTKGGIVGTVDTASGKVFGTLRLAGERIVNSSAADETGAVFIASSEALYRFDSDSFGAPAITWREAYDPGTHVKAGQVDTGTGTTPTLMGTEYVTITDNADPQMRVLVYRRAKSVSGPRLVCAEPVFQPGNSCTENSLVATDKSIVVENNFGAKTVDDVTNGRTSKPGLTRIDLNEDGKGCHTVWTNDEVNIPTVVTKMSLANGLIYTYTKPKGPANTDTWYITAVDFETGQTVFKQLAGTGLLFNNQYSPLYLGPDGALYVAVIGGIVQMRDSQ